MKRTDPQRERWKEQAEFMRSVGASHATWHDDGNLTSLTLEARTPTPVASKQPEKGPAARMMESMEKRHAVMFAASSVRPKLVIKESPSAVPRAVRAKEEAARGEAKNAG
jgi:hypothetical protein